MELKSLIKPRLTVILLRSNRTFMELKFIKVYFHDDTVEVLIAPLWN